MQAQLRSVCIEMSLSRKVTRVSLTGEEKCAIAKRKVQTGHSEEIVAAWFKQQTGKEIHRSVVGKAVRAGFQDMHLGTPEAKWRKRRSPMWPLLDKGLYEWFCR